MNNHKKLYNFVVMPLVVLCAGIIRSLCVEVFTIPFDFAPGGSTGIASMVEFATGGTDIVAMFIQRKFSSTSVAWFIYAIDAIIVIVSAFVFKNGLTPVLMSLTEMFCLSLMSDVISAGFRTAYKFEIITHNPNELSSELIQKLGRGVTRLAATGMYSHDEKSLLICVIRKRQLAEFKKILSKYEDTFAYVTSTSEVMGLGFTRWAALPPADAKSEELAKTLEVGDKIGGENLAEAAATAEPTNAEN